MAPIRMDIYGDFGDALWHLAYQSIKHHVKHEEPLINHQEPIINM